MGTQEFVARRLEEVRRLQKRYPIQDASNRELDMRLCRLSLQIVALAGKNYGQTRAEMLESERVLVYPFSGDGGAFWKTKIQTAEELRDVPGSDFFDIQHQASDKILLFDSQAEYMVQLPFILKGERVIARTRYIGHEQNRLARS